MRTVSTRKRGKTWYYSFECGDNIAGQRKRVEKGGFETKKEAFEAGTKALAKYFSGDLSVASSKMTMDIFLKEWLRIKSTSIRPKTFSIYNYVVKSISGILGDKSLKDIRPKHIEEMMVRLKNKGYSKGTLTRFLVVLKQIFDYAIYPAELRQDNPAKYIKLPKNAPENVIERRVISETELNQILKNIPFGHYCHVPIIIVYHTGLRAGEVLGLTWEDIDLTNKTISINKQLVFADKYILTPPKTSTSKRIIPIDDNLVKFLRKWREYQNNLRLSQSKYKENYTDEENRIWSITKDAKTKFKFQNFVCTHSIGTVVKYSELQTIARKYGFNFHSLRHTHATLCAENGAPIKGLAGRLGHSNITLTANLYTHETEKMQAETLDAFQKKLKMKTVGKM